MNGYKHGSITEKLNKLKSNPSQKPIGTLPFDPSINIVGSMIGKPNQALPISSTSSLIPQFTNPAPIAKTNVPIVAKPKPTGIIPPPPAPSIPPEKDQTKNNQNPTEKDQTKNNQNPIIPSPPIEKKKEESDTDANFLASLIGQGFAMMGAGIANRDPGQVGQQISQNRFNQEKYASEEEQRKLLNKERLDQIERAKRLLDPQSEESKQKRMTYGKALGLNIPESTTAADLENSDFLRSLMHDKDMQSKMALENQKLGMRGSGGSGTGVGKPGKDAFQKEKAEINARSKTTIDALNKIEQMVKNKGTRELFGSHEKEMDQLINSVAVNYNKVLDPTGVVREGEAATIAENLGLRGTGSYFTSKDTAINQIRNFKNLVEQTRNNQLSSYNELPTQQDLTPLEKQIVSDYKNNPDDPKVKSVYDKMVKIKGLGF